MMDWYPKDFEAYARDTRHLTTLEHGAYNLLLDEYYRTRQPLPDNDNVLAYLARMTVNDWQRIAPTIRAFFEAKGGMLHQKKANRVLDEQDQRARKQTEKSRKGAEVRWGKIKELDTTGNATGIPQAMPNDATKTTTQTTTGTETDLNNKHPALAARDVIELFDKTQAQVFNGNRRAFPAGDDIVYAQRWVDAGIELPALEGLFVSKLTARKSRGEETIGSLKFLDRSVADLITKGKRLAPLPRAAPKVQRPQAGNTMQEMRDEAEKIFGKG